MAKRSNKFEATPDATSRHRKAGKTLSACCADDGLCDGLVEGAGVGSIDGDGVGRNVGLGEGAGVGRGVG